jgi:hypothetical protein
MGKADSGSRGHLGYNQRIYVDYKGKKVLANYLGPADVQGNIRIFIPSMKRYITTWTYMTVDEEKLELIGDIMKS